MIAYEEMTSIAASLSQIDEKFTNVKKLFKEPFFLALVIINKIIKIITLKKKLKL